MFPSQNCDKVLSLFRQNFLTKIVSVNNVLSLFRHYYFLSYCYILYNFYKLNVIFNWNIF